MPVDVKICGLTDPHAVEAAVTGGAAFLGAVFHEPSPRCVSPASARALFRDVPAGVGRVGLVVDAGDADIEAILATAGLDLLQLHGHETPERCAEVRERFGVTVMKALGIGQMDDLEGVPPYAAAADRLLFDARPPAGATRPGGNARRFEWAILKDTTWPVPWMLAGGLDADCLADAVTASGAPAVDVSSGVEREGRKDPGLIRAFLETARSL